MPSRRGLPADAGDGDGRAAGADRLDQQRGHHLGAGRVRAGRRPTDPAPANAFGHLDAFIYPGAVDLPKRAFTRPSIRWLRTAAILDPQIVGERALRVARRVQGDPPALSRTAGHHRDPRRRRTERRGQDRSCIAPAGSSGSCRSRSSWPRRSPARPASTADRGDDPLFKEIIEGKHDDVPEQAFLLKGDDRGRTRGSEGWGEEEGLGFRLRR